MICTQSLFHSLSSDFLAVNLAYCIFYRFVRLASVTLFYFLPDGFYNAGPVQMLENYCLCSIHSWTKNIGTVPM